MSEPCRCERADAITSLVAISRMVEKVGQERDEALARNERQRATLASIRAIVGAGGWDAASARADIRAALDSTS